MDEVRPAIDEWKALYVAAVEFRKLAPWAWVSDAEIFGVQNHTTGEIGYCCIMGELGEFLGMAVYSGTDGLAGYLKLQNGEIGTEDPDALYIQNCLMTSFENKSFIEKEDMNIIKEAGLQFKGRKAWPLFRSYKPGYFPWFLNRDEALYMTDVLKQAKDMCLRLKENNKLLLAPKKNQYLVRVPEIKGDTVAWKDEWREPGPVKPEDTVIVHVNEVRLQRIKNSLKQAAAIWEIDFFLAPTPVMEGGRPYFPQAIMIADHDTGFIREVHLASKDTCQIEFSDKFLLCMETAEAVPLEILVRKKENAKCLGPIAALLNIKLSEVKKLQNIDNARRSMMKFFSR